MRTKPSRLITAALLTILASSLVFAQGAMGTGPAGQTTKGAVIKGKAPVNKNVLKVKLPKAQEATLPNGLRVILLESHKVPTFTMQLVVLSGGLADRPDYHGLAAFSAALMCEGTAKHSVKDITDQVDARGAPPSPPSRH